MKRIMLDVYSFTCRQLFGLIAEGKLSSDQHGATLSAVRWHYSACIYVHVSMVCVLVAHAAVYKKSRDS